MQISAVAKMGRRAALAVVTAGTVFQISSCSIDQTGVINAFANPVALSDLRNQLFEASPVGQLLDNIHGSVEVNVGTQE